MTRSVESQAELGKLARVLGTDAARLSSLGGLAIADIRALRRQVADALLEADRARFSRLAALGKAMPCALVAKLAEHALGPVAIARAAGLADPELACEIALRVSPDFLADVAVELDPRHAHAAIAGLPPAPIAAAAGVLERRAEHAAMGVFVGHLSDAALAATIDTLSSGAILRIGFLIEAPERLDEIVAQLPDERLGALVALAASEDRWNELFAIAGHLGPEGRARLEGRVEHAPANRSLAAPVERDPALRRTGSSRRASSPRAA